MLRGSLAGLKSLRSQSQQFQKFPSGPLANVGFGRDYSSERIALDAERSSCNNKFVISGDLSAWSPTFQVLLPLNQIDWLKGAGA